MYYVCKYYVLVGTSVNNSGGLLAWHSTYGFLTTFYYFVILDAKAKTVGPVISAEDALAKKSWATLFRSHNEHEVNTFCLNMDVSSTLAQTIASGDRLIARERLLSDRFDMDHVIALAVGKELLEVNSSPVLSISFGSNSTDLASTSWSSSSSGDSASPRLEEYTNLYTVHVQYLYNTVILITVLSHLFESHHLRSPQVCDERSGRIGRRLESEQTEDRAAAPPAIPPAAPVPAATRREEAWRVEATRAGDALAREGGDHVGHCA